jgi:hypothetical protein
MGRARELPAFGVAALGEGAEIDIDRRTHGDGNVAAAQLAQHAIEHFGAGWRIAETGGHADDLKFRTGKCQPQREGIVDIVADIAVDDDFFPRLRRAAVTIPMILRIFPPLLLLAP